MKNIKVDFITNSIIVTAAFMKRASKPYSLEFEDLVRLRNQLPKFSVTVIPSKRKEKKTSITEETAMEVA